MLHKSKQWLSENKTVIITSFLLFLIAFLPRIINLTGHSIFTDEVQWQQRAGALIKALSFRNFSLLTKADKMHNTLTIGLPTTFLIALSKLLLGKWTSATFYSRFPFTLIGSFTVVGFYLFMRRLKRPEIGIIGALFLALEPSFIAMSRWAHRDVMLTFLFFLSIAFFYLGETENRFSFKIYSSIFFAIAFLAKISAVIIPVILISWKVILYLRTNNNNKILKILKFNFELKELSLPFISALIVFLFWPAMWKNPLSFGRTYFSSQFQELEGSHSSMLLLGKLYQVPPYYYYLVILFIRLSPVILLSLILGIILYFVNLNKQTKADSDLWTLAFLWLVLFLCVASLSAKMYEVRYILPTWPAIAFLVGYGLFLSFSYIKQLNKKQIVACASTLIVLFELPVAFIYSPNFYMYYNAFVGGPKGVYKNKTSFIGGGGEATKSLAIFVNKHFKNKNLKIVYFGYNFQFDYYLDKSLKKDVKYNSLYLRLKKKKKGFAMILNYSFRNKDVVVLENAVSAVDLGPTKKSIISSGLFKIVYTSRILGTDLGWVFVKKNKHNILGYSH